MKEALEIAEEVGYSLPLNRTSKEPRVPTSDFVIDLTVGGQRIKVVRAIKLAEDLSKKRTLLSLEVDADTGNDAPSTGR